MLRTLHPRGRRRSTGAGISRSVILLLALVCVGLAAAVLVPRAQPAGSGATAEAGEELVIVSDGNRHPFRVEVARTPSEQALGLMYRRSLPADHGMLFVHPRPRPVSMWMKNTFIPLDMLFIAEDGRIARIAAQTTPLSEASIPSGGPVRAVLELNAGTAERLGIEVGDRVEHPLLDGAR